MELAGFCTVKALNYKNDFKQIEWDLAGSLKQYPLNSTQFALSQTSGNWSSEDIILEILPNPTQLTESKASGFRAFTVQNPVNSTRYAWSPAGNFPGVVFIIKQVIV